MKKKQSQSSEILKYLKTHKKGISSMQAFELFGATRLSSIIFSLRHRGYDIESVEDTAPTRYGTTTRFVRYVLKDEKK